MEKSKLISAANAARQTAIREGLTLAGAVQAGTRQARSALGKFYRGGMNAVDFAALLDAEIDSLLSEQGIETTVD